MAYDQAVKFDYWSRKPLICLSIIVHLMVSSFLTWILELRVRVRASISSKPRSSEIPAQLDILWFKIICCC